MRKIKVSEMLRLTPEEYKKSEKLPVVVVLDNVRSMNNVGSIFRTCDTFRVKAIFLCGITPLPPHPDIHKTALGAEESVDWYYYKTTEEAVNVLREENFTLCSIEQVHGSCKLNEFKYENIKPYAIIFGNEVDGIDQAIVDKSDLCLEIPQLGTKHSMNVSVTAGVVLWEIFRQWSN